MNIEGEANIVKIYVGESDKVNVHPLYEEIVFAARESGMAGATVFKGIFSFGASHSIHTMKIFALSSDLPVLVEIIDNQKNIEMFCPILYKLMDESKKGGLVTLEKVDVLRYRKGQKYNEFTTF